MRNPYEVLGVDSSADLAAIKKAYRSLTRKYHPDHNQNDPGAMEKFKEISSAYDILSNPDKKKKYDQFGDASAGAGAGGFGGFGQGGTGGFGDGGFNFEDLFRNAGFGGQSGQQSNVRQQTEDAEFELHLDLASILESQKITLNPSLYVSCKTCNGKGAEKSSDIQTCSQCRGAGVTQGQGGILGMVFQQTCSKCRGEGSVIKNPCKTCHGDGRIKQKKEISLTIPAGVENGQTLRVNQGHYPYRGKGQSGSIYLHILIKDSPDFKRQGSDLYTHVRVPFTQASLGAKITVKGLDGNFTISVPKGTQANEPLRINSKGLPQYNGTRRGDLYCFIEIFTPVNLNDEQQQLLRDLDQSLTASNMPKKIKSFKQRFQDFFR